MNKEEERETESENKKKRRSTSTDVTLDWANSCRKAGRNLSPSNNNTETECQVGGITVKPVRRNHPRHQILSNEGISQHLYSV